MAYDDIRISELPSLPEIHNNDLFLIQDVTNNLAHKLDWGRLKNNIGRLSKGIIFPLGTEQEPEIAIGDYTSGIMAEDYGTFVIVTHGEKRFKVNQAGSMELINGNVVIGNFDRQCTYTLTVNNLTRFNCYARFGDDLDVDGNLDVGGNITGGKDLNIPGNVILGSSCEDNLIINSEIRAYCSMDLKGSMAIHESLTVDNSARILHDVALGSDCSDKFDVYSNAWFRCDLRVDGDLTFGGDLVLDGDVSIGGGCSNTINLYGETTVHCDLRVKGDTFLEQNLYVNGNGSIDGNFNAMQDVYLGNGCQYTTTINSTLTAECTSFFRGDVTIGDDSIPCPGTHLQVNGVIESKCDTIVHKDLLVDHNTTLGTDCGDDLLVKATPVFECDATFEKGVNITETLYVGGDFTTDSHITDIGDNRGCLNPNLINLHGEVHIDCNLFVSGDVFYDGDLSITGPDITFGSGCGLSTIHLQGYTVAYCDMLIKGDTRPFALVVEENAEVRGNTELRGLLNVAGNSAHDANLYVHEDTLLNLPISSYDYWEQCECVPLNFPDVQKRAPSQTTFIHGTQKSLCQVRLNDPRWYRENSDDATTHKQETSVYGSFYAYSHVVLNSNSVPSDVDLHVNGTSTVPGSAANQDGGTNCLQSTLIHGRLFQDCTVVLNQEIEAHKRMEFNDTPNEQKTIIKGDTHILHNLEVGRYDNTERCNELTRINNKFEAKCDARMNENVVLNGGQDFIQVTQCDVTTDIMGRLMQRSKVQLNMDSNCCPITGLNFSDADVQNGGTKGNKEDTIIHGDTHIKANVLLNRGCGDLTRIKGKLEAKCDTHLNENVELNGGQGSSGTTQCNKITSIFGQLQQYAKVELNKDSTCCGASGQNFNSTNNNRCSIIHGDLDVKASVILNRGSGDLTKVKGKLEVDYESRLKDDVHLNGGASGTQNQNCGKTTRIHGKMFSECDVTLNSVCGQTTTVKGTFISECSNVLGKPGQCGNNDFTTINGNLKLMNGIELDGGYGAVKVSEGAAGFFVSGGGSCIRNKWHHAVTTAKGTTPIGNSKSPINISVADSGGVTGSGDITISGEAGNGEYKVTTTGNGIVVGTGSVRANQTADTSQELSFSCSDANLGTLLGSDGVIGSYDPCGGKDQSIKFDCSTAGLGSLSTGNGISGGYEPCNGGSIAFECATAGLGTLAGSNGINGGYDPCGGKNQSITFDCSTANLGTLLGSDGISGAYDPCGGKNQSIKFDCSAAGLGDLSTGNGISGNYEPCKGGSIAFDCGSAGLGSLSTSNGISGNYEPCNGGSITFDCASAGLGGLSTGNGISGGYDPCGGGSVAFDCASAGLGSLSTGSGISGSYDPCGGGSITFDCATAGLGTHTIAVGAGILLTGSATFNPCSNATTTLTFDPSVLPPPTPPTTACPDGGLIYDAANSCLSVDTSGCPEASVQDRALKQVSTGPGTSGAPAFVINAKQGGSTWCGMKTNDGSKVFTVSVGDGWSQNGCTGQGANGKKIFQVALSGANNSVFESIGIGNNVDPAGQPVFAANRDGGAPGNGTVSNRLFYDKNAFRRGDIDEVVRSTDSRVNVDIDSAIAAFGGYSDDPETSNGLFRWGLKDVSGMEESDTIAQYPYAFIDSSEVASVLPYFVDYVPSRDAFEAVPVYEDDDEGGKTDVVDYYEYNLKEDFDPSTDLAVGRVNQNAINGLALAGLARHKRLIDNVTNDAELTGDTDVQGPITFGDIVKIDLASLTDAADDTAAAAAGVEVGQVYRNGSQLMVRVS